MDFENLNVNKLRSSLSSLNDISNNKNSLKKVSDSLSASNWTENSRVRIKNALDEMNAIYDEIEKYISKCTTAADYIEQYKALETQNKQYQYKLESSKKQIKNASEEYDTSSLEKKVNQYESSIYKNNSKKNILKEKIINLIS